jgi:hypothetical protein
VMRATVLSASVWVGLKANSYSMLKRGAAPSLESVEGEARGPGKQQNTPTVSHTYDTPPSYRTRYRTVPGTVYRTPRFFADFKSPITDTVLRGGDF